MFKNLLKLIQSENRTDQSEPQVLFASLLVRAARIDNEYSDPEKDQIDKTLMTKFSIPKLKAKEIHTYKKLININKNPINPVSASNCK